MDRIANIELDEAAPGIVARAIDPQAEALTQQERVRRLALEAGIRIPATRVPAGEALWESGYERVRTLREEMARLPDANPGLELVEEYIEAQQAKDVPMVLSDLRLGDKGRMVHAEAPERGMCYSPRAFQQYIALAYQGASPPRGIASTLAYLPPDIRAIALNRRMAALPEDRANSVVTLRTRKVDDGARVVRAVLSDRYADIPDSVIAEGIATALNGSGATAKLDYKPGDARSRFEVIFPSEIHIPNLRVGDLHKAFVDIGNSETGEQSVTVRAGLVTIACYNATLATGEGIEVKIRHLGNEERVRAAVKAAIRTAISQIEPLIATIQKGAAIRLEKPVGDIIAELAKKHTINDGVAEAWSKTYAGAYATGTAWELVSALTDTAQKVSGWWGEQEELEVKASNILHQFVRVARA